jgi:hypothetical protein
MEQHEPQIHDVWAKRERPARLSPEPLLAITQEMPVREAAQMLGINVGTLQKWRNGDTQHGLHYALADRIAVRNLGTHPAVIWGNDWWKV